MSKKSTSHGTASIREARMLDINLSSNGRGASRGEDLETIAKAKKSQTNHKTPSSEGDFCFLAGRSLRENY